MVNRWTFYDPTDDSSYQFEINPNQGGTPTLTRNIKYQSSSGVNGSPILFQGRDSLSQVQVSGVIRERSHLEAMQEWYSKQRVVQITDDLLREFSVFITGFSANRKRSAAYPWKHDYTLNYVILSESAAPLPHIHVAAPFTAEATMTAVVVHNEATTTPEADVTSEPSVTSPGDSSPGT